MVCINGMQCVRAGSSVHARGSTTAQKRSGVRHHQARPPASIPTPSTAPCPLQGGRPTQRSRPPLHSITKLAQCRNWHRNYYTRIGHPVTRRPYVPQPKPAKLSGAGDRNPVRQTQQQPGNAVNTTTRANAVTKKRTRQQQKQQHSARLPRAGSPPTHESVPVPAHATARTTPPRTRAAISTTTSSTAATAQQ